MYYVHVYNSSGLFEGYTGTCIATFIDVRTCYTASNKVGVWTKYWWLEIIPTECHREQNYILVNSPMIIPIGFKNRQIERTTDVEKGNPQNATSNSRERALHIYRYTDVPLSRMDIFFFFISFRYMIESEILHFNISMGRDFYAIAYHLVIFLQVYEASLLPRQIPRNFAII